MSRARRTFVLSVLEQELVVVVNDGIVTLGGSIRPALGDEETDEFVASLLERMIASHAARGLDLDHPAYVVGIEAALNAAYDRLS